MRYGGHRVDVDVLVDGIEVMPRRITQQSRGDDGRAATIYGL